MRSIIFGIFFTFLFISDLLGQGCVAIRGSSSCGMDMSDNFNLLAGEFLTSSSFRYFKSFRHFRGSEEETHRLDDGTEVINTSYFLDLSISYGITHRLYGNIILPFVDHTRSSMYEHGGNPPNGLGERHKTYSRGLADMRLGMGYWLFKPEKYKYNYSLGLGVKLPTGRYDYSDTFYNQGENRDQVLEKVVDQSIQPGDGGTGFYLETQGFHPLSHKLILATNFYYLFNIKETNGVLTRNGRSEFSCPDQYAARIGGYYVSGKGFDFYLGGRIEGIPSSDLIGGSAGYRRPGYVISVEPGINYNWKSFSFNLNIPIALERNRTQSFEDKIRTTQTGNYVHGDAAFADFLISAGISYKFQPVKSKNKTFESI